MRAGIADLLRFRLSAHGIAGTASATAPTATTTVRRMLAMQAQDFAAACWAIGLRTPTALVTDVLSAMDRGEIVRSWPMRGTLHALAAEDLGWMLAVTAPRMLASARTRERTLEIDAQVLAQAGEAAVAMLGGGRSASRDEYMAALEAAGIGTGGQRGYHLIWHLAQNGLLCWGPTQRAQQALVLLDEWVREPRRLQGDEALRELVSRYLDGHGPATLADIVWWSKITVAEAKRGVAAAGDGILTLTIDDRPYLVSRRQAENAPTHPLTRGDREAVYALPGYDEYLLGYRERSAVLDDAHASLIVPGGNGVFQPTIVAGGRVVGTWRRSTGAGGVTVRPLPFEASPAWQRRGIARAADAYGRFMGVPVTLA